MVKKGIGTKGILKILVYFGCDIVTGFISDLI